MIQVPLSCSARSRLRAAREGHLELKVCLAETDSAAMCCERPDFCLLSVLAQAKSLSSGRFQHIADGQYDAGAGLGVAAQIVGLALKLTLHF